MREIVFGASITLSFKRIVFIPYPPKSYTVMENIRRNLTNYVGWSFIEGFPQDLNQLTQGHDQTLLILDDLMSECSKDQRVSDLFYKGFHIIRVFLCYILPRIYSRQENYRELLSNYMRKCQESERVPDSDREILCN